MDLRALAEAYIEWRILVDACRTAGTAVPWHRYPAMKRREIAKFSGYRTMENKRYREVATFRAELTTAVEAEALKILNERLGK